MSDKCPKCGAEATLYRGDFGVIYECETSITHGKIEEGEDCLRCQLDHAQARYDALRITSETTIGQLRQQAKHLEDRAKELEESQDDAESIMSCLAMFSRGLPEGMSPIDPVIRQGNSTVTAGVFFLARDWFVARLDAEKRAEWEKLEAEMRAEGRPGSIT